MIIGHENIVNFFNKAIENNRLSHAYCLVGSEHVGKRKVADFVSSKILGVKEEMLFSSPDFFVVNKQKDEKTGKTKKDISVEQVRELINFVSMKPFAKGGRKVCIIDGADNMNVKGYNALLKTLEEPSDRTVLFLLVSDEQNVLLTIKSRCQMLYLQRVSSDLILNYLESSGIDKNKSLKIVEYALGLPGLAISFASNDSVLEDYENEVLRFESFIGKSFYDKIKIAETLFSDKEDHIAARDRLLWILQLWRKLILNHLRCQNGRKNFSAHNSDANWSRCNFLKVDERIRTAEENILNNVHPRLLIENILLYLP
jgi:DNA polymerase-3 subunit delta'